MVKIVIFDKNAERVVFYKNCSFFARVSGVAQTSTSKACFYKNLIFLTPFFLIFLTPKRTTRLASHFCAVRRFNGRLSSAFGSQRWDNEIFGFGVLL